MLQLVDESASLLDEISNLAKDSRTLEEKLTGFVRAVEILAKRQDSQLGTKAEQISMIMERMTDCFFSIDNQWNFVYMNKAAEKTLKIHRQEFLGKNFWEVTKDNPFSFVEKYREAMTSQSILSFEGFSTRVDKWFDVEVYPSDGGLSVFLRDITERKKTLEEFKRFEERFSKVFHHSSSIMAIVRQEDLKYVDVNKGFEKATGYTREEIIGLTALEINLWAEEEQTSLVDAFVLQGSLKNCEVKIMNKFGEPRTALLSSDLIEAGGEKLIIIVAHDITDIRLLEEEVTRLEGFSSMAQLAASISHEVRNPMTTVRGFLQLLRERPKYSEDKEFFELMISELDRANAILTEFLSLSKPEAGERRNKNLNKILNDIFPLILGDAIKADKNILLNQQPVSNLYLNRKEIHQLILNLTRNGLEAMSPGGKLIISTFQDAENIVLSFKDEGTGIPEEIIAKLGRPFITTKENGTGMGLAVCYSIASRHNAAITVETSSLGTTFFVRFKGKDDTLVDLNETDSQITFMDNLTDSPDIFKFKE